MLSPLSEDEFHSTFGERMIDITETHEATVDIWPYVQRLVQARLVHEIVYDKQLVEYVYSSVGKSYYHVLLPTDNSNVFVVIVVDLLHQNIKGHFNLDRNEKYGLT